MYYISRPGTVNFTRKAASGIAFIRLYFLFPDINECVNSPCQNGATCINNHGSYQCKCKPGFSGKQCEQGKLFVERSLWVLQTSASVGTAWHSENLNIRLSWKENFLVILFPNKHRRIPVPNYEWVNVIFDNVVRTTYAHSGVKMRLRSQKMTKSDF